MLAKRASGYVPTKNDAYEISMTTLDMIGDGGIFTTINDIKKWNDAFYQSSVLSPAFWQEMSAQGLLNNGKQISYASGLFFADYKGLKTVSHGGSFVGFRAELLRFPQQKFTVAIFANRDDADPTTMAYEVADVFLSGLYKAEEQAEKTQDNAVQNDTTTVAKTADIKLIDEQLLGCMSYNTGCKAHAAERKTACYAVMECY